MAISSRENLPGIIFNLPGFAATSPEEAMLSNAKQSIRPENIASITSAIPANRTIVVFGAAAGANP